MIYDQPFDRAQAQRPVPAGALTGTVITAGVVRKPAGSTLWSLRARQDRLFHPAPSDVGRP